MDPLSLTVSILGLIHATKSASRGVQRLLAVRHASTAIAQLNNEISTFRLLMNDIQNTMMDGQVLSPVGLRLCVGAPTGALNLANNLDAAKESLSNLEMMVHYDLQNVDGSADRFAWFFRGKNSAELHDRMRQARSNVVNSLVVLNLVTLQTMQTQVGQIQLATASSLQALQNVEQKLVPISPSLDRLEAGMQVLARKIDDIKLNRPHPDNHPDVKSEPKSSATPFFDMVALRVVQRSKCDSWCRCPCHIPGSFKSPAIFKSVLGLLYAGYLGTPALRAPCTLKQCHNRFVLHVTYLFPSWFLARAWEMAFVHMQNGFKFEFRMHHTRSDSDVGFAFAESGNVAGLQELIRTKTISVLDVTSNNGHTLLHTALRYCRLEVVQLLIKSEAEIHYENFHQESAYDMAWNNILCFQNTSREEEFHIRRLLELFPSADKCEERRQLTKLHKIVLGLLHYDLEQEIQLDRSAVDGTDADGKTALYWAAARGDANRVSILLRYGADPDKKDYIGQGPLRASIKAKDPDWMNLILDAGATVDQRDNWKQTCLIAIHYYPEPHRFVRKLLAKHADPNAQDFRGDTALIKTSKGAYGGHHLSAAVLLKARADVNLQNKAGHSALHAAIASNAHHVLKVLTSLSKVNARLHTAAGETILHLAAVAADAETLRILSQQPWPYSLDVDRPRHDGRTAAELAHSRFPDDHDHELDAVTGQSPEKGNPSWVHTWRDLLAAVAAPLTVKTSWSFRAVESAETSLDPESWHSLSSQSAAEMGESWHSTRPDSTSLRDVWDNGTTETSKATIEECIAEIF